ncbi:hypothetical protein HQ45_09460 [Porphyromonas crevioricanis]|nr:hypothetical protein HQ45_09460 [Porphyromonas crevioricanis]KGN95843.1 hypothetical protein HQ38_02410 [Porphyromonas crevioricanis]GAD04897.1 lipoprotein, putative [Porphyromonas crevioricanis JCM 15906]GAD06833.1 lipoprotein, putative [Porphyromonas crevioricanis JCM 13913]
MLSCVHNPMPQEYIRFQQIEGSRWEAGKNYDFELLIPDCSKSYSAELLLRHNNDYKYTHIALVASLHDFKEKIVWADSVTPSFSFSPLHWKGQGLAQRELSVPLFDGRYFELSGIYRLSLRTQLQQVALLGMEAVGIRFWQCPDAPHVSDNED